jgi:hypothetical protein
MLDEITFRTVAATIIKNALSVGDEIVHVEQYEGDGDAFIEHLTQDVTGRSGYGIIIPADLGSENGDTTSGGKRAGLNELFSIAIDIQYNPTMKAISEISLMSQLIKQAFIAANQQDETRPWIWPTGTITTFDSSGADAIKRIIIQARIFQ